MVSPEGKAVDPSMVKEDPSMVKEVLDWKPSTSVFEV
jgi:hypothetical protein